MDIIFAFKPGTGLGKDGCKRRRPGYANGLRVGTLNIQTLTGKVEEIVDVMERRKLDVLGLAETRWKGEGRRELRKGYRLYWSGNSEGRSSGVGVVVRDGMKEEVKGISDRIMKIRVTVKGRSLEIAQVYAPQVGCTAQEKEDFEEELQQQLNGQSIIVMGDLNAHVGSERQGYENVLGAEGWGSRNEEGRKLLDFCKRNGLVVGNSWFRKKESHKVTWYSSDLTKKSLVDYMLYDWEMKRSVRDIKVIPSEALDSDHRILVMNLGVVKDSKRTEYQERRIKVWKLKEKEVKEEFQKIIRERMPTDNPKTGEEEWKQFKNTMVEAAVAVCGRTSNRKRCKETPWWNERVKEAVGRKNKAFRVWFQERTDLAREDYKIKKKEANKIVAEERKKWMVKWTEMMEEDSRGNKKVLYGMVKSKRRGLREDVVMMDKNGNEVHNKETLKTVWKEYFEDLLNPNGHREEDNVLEDGEDNTGMEKDLTWRELEMAIDKMKGGRAPGVDEVSVEMVKAAGEVGKQWLYRVMRVIWKEKKTPEDWKKGLIVPIFKKGSRKECRNYRGVTLIPHCAKIYEKILESRIRAKVERKLREEQYGFRPGRSTVDLIFSVRQLQEHHYEFGEDLLMAFLDIEKAYDSVCREKVWKAMENMGVEKGTVGRVKEMYCGSVSCVKVGGERTDWFRQMSGLKQGSALSPLLFIVVMDEVMTRIAGKIGEDKMKAMVFADDLMVWGNKEEEIQEQLKAWEETVGEYGWKFNISKCEILLTTRKKDRPMSGITLGGGQLKKVESLKYLGSIVEENGRNDKEITERGRQAEAFLRSIRSLVWNKDVPQKSKEVLYRSYYIPILTYASETWTMKKRDISRIQAGEMKFLRSRIGVTRRDRVRNEKVREMVKEEPLQGRIETSRLRWYGHLKRMDEKKIPKRIHEMQMQKKRPRGRPRDRWLKGVEECVKKRGEDWTRVTAERWWEERTKWRGLCSKQTQPGAGNCTR